MKAERKSPSSQIMIRTRENVLSGPFPKEQIVQRILSGELNETTEVCAGDGYWIYLHERLESRMLLGVELSHPEEFHEEATETGTETATVTATRPVDTAHDGLPTSEVSADLPRGSQSQNQSRNGKTETLGALKIIVWGIIIIVSFILFQVFRITEGF